MTRSDATLKIALNGETGESAPVTAIALAAEGGAPEWVQLLPRGPVVAGRDGRRWRLDDPQVVLNAFRDNAAPLPIDWEHAQDLRAPNGEEAPAAGWIEELEARNGEVWGRVSWTERGARAVAAREYRFLSPAIRFRPTGEIVSVKGAGLVNHPNFHMTALNREGSNMDKELLKALGLSETATVADAIAKVTADRQALETALNRELTPDLTKFVPRADFDVALNRATAAEGMLAEQKKQALETAINSEIDAAVAAGKIAPASKDFYLATCRADGGLDRFKAFVAGQPSHFAPTKTEGDPKTQTALNAQEREVIEMMGVSEEAYLKARG